MNCIKCGYQLADNDQFCKNCGTTVGGVGSVQLQGGVSSPSITPMPANDSFNSNVNVVNQQPANNNVVQDAVVNPGVAVNNPVPTSQPVINQQPVYSNASIGNGMGGAVNAVNNQPVNTQPSPNQFNNNSSTNNNMKFIILGVAIVAAVFIIIVVVSVVLGGDKGLSSKEDGKISETASNSSYKVKYKNFELSIPDNMIYEVGTDSILIGDESDTWAAMVEIGEGSYSSMKANKAQLATLLQQNGYTASAAQEKKLGGVEYITTEVSYSGEQRIIAYSRVNSMNLFGAEIMTKSNEFDYSVLEKIAPIVSSIKTVEAMNSIKPSFNVHKGVFAEFAK